MLSKLLSTEILVIRCFNNLIFAGMGCMLYVFETSNYKLQRKIHCFDSCNIHGLVEQTDNVLTVFGSNCFRSYKIYKTEETLIVREESSKIELNDWIIAAKWITFNEHERLYLLLAHNNVHICDSFNKSYQDTWCEEKCILYSGSVVRNDKVVLILSGTVYQEILIWAVDPVRPSNASAVLHRLQGHEGVIFSVVYNAIAQVICSTSDDRTIRLWKIMSDKEKEIDLDWKKVNIKLMRTMYGHTARVWKCIIRNNTLISIGEDSQLCIWTMEGTLLSKICAHHGAAIWSMDVSEDGESVFTGGADGAIRAWPLATPSIRGTVLLPNANIHGQLKYVCCLRSGTPVVFYETGIVLAFDKDDNNRQDSLYLRRYNSYCVMQVSSCHSYVSCASRDGHVAILKEGSADKILQQVLEVKIMESQILSIHWLEDRKIVACGLNGILKIFNFSLEGLVNVEALCLLPYSIERWLTAATMYEGFLICGDRSGSMHVFSMQDTNQISTLNHTNVPETYNKPVQTFKAVHGGIGIQSFATLNSKLMSTGRDGILRFYELSKRGSRSVLYPLHSAQMPMDWISGNLKASDDTLILGFQASKFVVYSILQQRVLLRIPCGGRHRSWDCLVSNNILTLIYIRMKQVHQSQVALSSFTFSVLLDRFHTKEINCLRPVSVDQNVFVSGGEDGAVRISCILQVENNYTFQTLGIFDGHLSTIKFLASLKLNQSDSLHNRYLIFSGGGRAQMKVWELYMESDETSLKPVEITCHDIMSHMLFGFDRFRRKQHQQPELTYSSLPETRYMDIDTYASEEESKHMLLFVACADGFVRIFLYDISIKQIQVKVHAKCADRCITKITVIKHKDKIIALTMSMDGFVRFIDFTSIVSKIVNLPDSKEENEHENCNDILINQFKLHQSGINSFDVRPINEGDFLLATGGDDNLFNLNRFTIRSPKDDKNVHISLISNWKKSDAHAAQITGILFQDADKIFSVSVDQQLVMYNYKYDEDLSAIVSKRFHTSVTDVKGLVSWNNSKYNSFITRLERYKKGCSIYTLTHNYSH